MDLAFIMAAAEAAEHAAEEHHKSETPFFIGGGVLALFAILISVFGFTRPDFPSSVGAQRLVIGVSTVLVLGAMSSAVYVAS